MSNHWLKLSLEYANQRSYLDDLFAVYPTIPSGIRDIDSTLWDKVETSYNKHDDRELIASLLKMKLFPIKDSYVAYFKRDSTALDRNPRTICRLASRIREMDLNELFKKCSEAKETNRQIGPMFKNWCHSGVLGIPSKKITEFSSTACDALLDASDHEMLRFAKINLSYCHEKGLDFIARISGKYFIGEAKFLTDFGGHQNAQLNDALATLKAPSDAIHLAILDGVPYVPGNSYMHKTITGSAYSSRNILSSLVLREFLYAQ
jgi:hypothetical protein